MDGYGKPRYRAPEGYAGVSYASFSPGRRAPGNYGASSGGFGYAPPHKKAAEPMVTLWDLSD